MHHGCKGYNDIKGTCPATLFDTKIISQNMEHFTSFIVCTLLLLNVYGTEGSSTSQQQCTLRNVCNLLDNVSNRQDRLEKKVKEHSAILGGRCDDGKVNEYLAVFFGQLH